MESIDSNLTLVLLILTLEVLKITVIIRTRWPFELVIKSGSVRIKGDEEVFRSIHLAPAKAGLPSKVYTPMPWLF